MKKQITILCLFLCCGFSYASTGNIEDNIADVVSWLLMLVLPLGGIYLFWKLHIYPEKIAEKKNHPQLNAIKSMCLLSLIFGGLLWPVALIWANYDYDQHLTREEKKAKKALERQKAAEELAAKETPQIEQTPNHQA